MIGSLIGMYATMVGATNLESFLNTASEGGEFNFNGGLLGKGLNKITKGVVKENFGLNFNIAGPTGNFKLLQKYGLKGLSKLLFSPVGMIAMTTMKAVNDARQDFLEEQYVNQIVDTPDTSNKYLLDERFGAVSSNAFGRMDSTNMAINSLLGSGNIASNMLDKALSKI